MTENLPAEYYDEPVEIQQQEKPKDKQARIFENEFDMGSMLPSAGQLDLDDKQLEILLAPVKDEDVEIRPDGLIYLPWMEYATRLNQAVGNGNWALIPQGMPRFAGNTIYWGHWLVVRGKMCGFAIGEQEYQPKSRTMSYGDACEGAWSNSLMRNCKHLGISLELWKPSFIRTWIEKYAEKHWDERKNRYLWRKKGKDIPAEEVIDDESPEPATKPKAKQKGEFDKSKLNRKKGSRSDKQKNSISKMAKAKWGEEIWVQKLHDLTQELLMDGVIENEPSADLSSYDASMLIENLSALLNKKDEQEPDF